MQLRHSNGYPIKGTEKSYSSYFSKNPDSRNKNEISINERKKRERENQHIKERGTILPSRTEIVFETKDKIECSCKGENEKCFKCNGSGLIEKPVKSLKGTKLYKATKKDTIEATKKPLVITYKQNKKLFRCEVCKRKTFKTKGALKQHQKTKHSKELKEKSETTEPNQRIRLSSSKSLRCKICDIFFKTEESLKIHMQSKHPKIF